MVDLDQNALRSKGMTPIDVTAAINAQNVTIPSGTAKIGRREYAVTTNSSPADPTMLNDVPIRAVDGKMVYMRDVAHVRDGWADQRNVVRANGRPAALLQIMKVGSVSTLDIIKQIKRDVLPLSRAAAPKGLDIRELFDQSIFVKASIKSVLREGVIAACLTALLILLFLGSWRSTVIIAISIPLSILTSIIALSALHETINLMTLGGLALAVGILVDDATVAIENIERNLAQGKDTVQAILDGSQEIAIPALVSTLCICIVFVPMFFLTGVAKFLFVPLAESVVFAMLASYVLSRTLVPTMAMYLLKGHHGEEYATGNDIFSRAQRGFARAFDRMRAGYRASLAFCLERAWLFVALFLVFCVASLSLVPVLGRDFFPSVDAGLIRLHMRARAGQRVEETAREADGVDNLIRGVIPAEDLGTILDNIGLFNSTVNTAYSNSGVIGESDAEIPIGLKPERKQQTRFYIDT